MLVANDDGDCALCCLRMLVDAMTPAECVECNAAVKLLADAETRNKLSFSNLQKTAEAAKNNETNSIPQFIVIDSDDEKVACIENENARQNNESCCVHVQNTAASSKWKHLLQPHEIALLVAFRRLSTAAQQLYSRLFVRKHVWRHSASIVASFRSFNIAAAVDECVAGGWLLQCASELDAAAVLHSLTLDQLKLLAKRLLLPASNGGKAHFLKAIVDHVTTPRKSHKVQAVLCFGSVTAATSSIRRTVKAICLLDAIALLEQEADIGPFLHIAHGETLVGLFKMLLPDAEPVNRNPKLISISSFLSPVILHSLGRIKYAAYAVDTVDVLWRTRAHFDAFLLAQSMYYEVCEMETATQTAYFVEMRDSLETSWLASLQAADELCISSPEQQFLLRFTAAHYATKTMAVMAASLDRNKQYAEAASVYHAILKAAIGKGKKTQFGGSKRGEWWLRLIILHARHLKDRLAACEVCELALADECVPAHKKMHFASRLQSMRAKEAPHDHAEKDKVNAPSPAFHTSNVEVCAIHAVAANAAAASKNRRSNNRVRLQNEHGAVYAVEQFAIQHFADDGWSGVHCEGALLATVCVLLFWDAIFADNIPLVFQSPFQTAPLDFWAGVSFFERRSALFEDRMRQLAAVDLPLNDELLAAHSRHASTAVVGVNWSVPCEVLQLFVTLLPRTGLLHCCHLLLCDWRGASAGFPDLFVWRDTLDTYRLVEVKSARDRLSDRQLWWISIFDKFGINFELLKLNG